MYLKTTFSFFIFVLMNLGTQAQDAALLLGDWSAPKNAKAIDLMRKVLDDALNSVGEGNDSVDLAALLSNGLANSLNTANSDSPYNQASKIDRFVFMADAKMAMGMYGDFVMGDYKLKDNLLQVSIAPSFGAEEVTFLLHKINADSLELIPQFETGRENADKRPLLFIKNKTALTPATKQDVLGFWWLYREEKEEEMPAEIIMTFDEDSVQLSDLPAQRFPWSLSPNGQFLMVTLADNPMVSIAAAAPGMMVLELRKENDLWYARSESSPELVHKPCDAEEDKVLEQKIIGTWRTQLEQENASIEYQIQKTGKLKTTVSASGLKKRTTADKWTWQACANAILLKKSKELISIKWLNYNELMMDGLSFKRVEE